jgi:flagellum-specific peptidoglycan hydrolase FlgJ
VTPKEQGAFIERVAPWAKFSQEKYGVPASVVIAQSILESGWGNSLLARKYNNFFGIKNSSAFNDGYVELRTTEYEGMNPSSVTARFESFADAQRGFEAHARLIAKSPRYEPAMADADDPFVFAARLKECGYSTDPNYASKLANLIMRYELKKFDAKHGAAKV